MEVIAEVPLVQIPIGSFYRADTQAGTYWVTRRGESFDAYSSTCTHQGCSVVWLDAENSFRCPCHGGRYDVRGNVLQGPPTAPLHRIETRVRQDVLELVAEAQVTERACTDTIIATDVRSAQELLRTSLGTNHPLMVRVSQLDTTPVIVVRLWFREDVPIPLDLETAVTPDTEFIDNFFFLNAFSADYDVEGRVVEVQSYRVDQWLDRSDEEILSVALKDIATFAPYLARPQLTFFFVQRHRALFTLYAPRKMRFRPGVDSGVEGLHLAGDWTEAEWSVWMMERAVVSGLRAANAVLARRGLPLVEIRRLPQEGFLLRLSRKICEALRALVFRRTQGPAPPIHSYVDPLAGTVSGPPAPPSKNGGPATPSARTLA